MFLRRTFSLLSVAKPLMIVTPASDVVYNPFTQRLAPLDSVFGKAMKAAGFEVDDSFKFKVPSTEDEIDWRALKIDGNPARLTGWKKKLRQIVDEAATATPGEEVGGQVSTPSQSALTSAKHHALQRFFDTAHRVCESGDSAATQVPYHEFTPDPAVEGIDMTPDQANVLRVVMKGYNVYVGGSAGTGKTMLLRIVHRRLADMGLRVGVCATTGVAGVNVNGCTFHHLFGVPMKEGDRWDSAAFRAFDSVIIDEVSLLDANLFEAFEREARRARLSNLPFGGMQVVLCGDFLQLSMASASEVPLYQSEAFMTKFAHIQLTSILRHNAADPLYPMLSRLRVGQWDDVVTTLSRGGDTSEHSEIPSQAIWMFPRRKHAEAMNKRRMDALPGEPVTFTPQRGPLQLVGLFTPSAIVSIPKAKSDSGDVFFSPRSLLTEDIILQLSEKSYIVAPADIVIMPTRDEPDTKFVVRLRTHAAQPLHKDLWRRVLEHAVKTVEGAAIEHWYDGPEPESLIPLAVTMSLMEKTNGALTVAPLQLKLDCRIMILRNLNRTVTNGSVGQVLSFEEPNFEKYPPQNIRRNQGVTQLPDKGLFKQLPVVELQDGSVFQIPPVSEVIGGRPESFFYGHHVYSLPMQPGYAFTVHKVQGLTLKDSVVLDCTDYFRCDHLVYVACSRVRSLGQLTVRGLEPRMIHVNKEALNFAHQLTNAMQEEDFEKIAFADLPCALWHKKLGTSSSASVLESPGSAGVEESTGTGSSSSAVEQSSETAKEDTDTNTADAAEREGNDGSGSGGTAEEEPNQKPQGEEEGNNSDTTEETGEAA